MIPADQNHVSDAEARDALDPNIGDGTPDTAPDVAATGEFPNKAIGAAVTAVATALVQYLSTGEFSMSQEGTTLIGGAVIALVVYLVSNARRLFGP